MDFSSTLIEPSLTELSVVFRDMLSLPQPCCEDARTPSIHVDMAEDAETLDLLLRFIYPGPKPKVVGIKQLTSLLPRCHG
jgi:hypothetical protein